MLGALLVFGAGVAAPEPAAIQQKRAQVGAIQAELAAIDAAVEQAAEAYNGARHELGLVRERIAANRAEIIRTERDLETAREVLARRLRDLYAQPEPTLVEVIVTTGSISAAADEIDLLDQVGRQDASVVETLKGTKARLEALRAELLADEERVAAAVAEAKRQKEKVESLLAQRQAVLENVKGELAQMIRAEEERQRRIAAQQAALARQRQAAAAAAAQAASALPVDPATGAPVATAPLPSGGGNASAAAVALQQVGTPYVWAGAAPGGFDCSGLASYAYAQIGKNVPHSTYSIQRQFPAVPRDQLAAGDMVFFSGGGHMGIYVGGGQFVHAPRTGDVVKVESLSSRGDYAGAVRA